MIFSVFFIITSGFSQNEVRYDLNPKAGKFVKVNGIRLYYETYGQGQPLVLLHGNNSSISDFNYQIPEFQKYYKVIAIDSRGQGNSTNDYSRQITYSLMASDVAGLLDSLHLDSVYVYGHSDGGITGLELAFSFPKKVKKLVAGSPNYTHDTSAIDAYVLGKIRNCSYKDINPSHKNKLYRTSKTRKQDSITFEQIKFMLLNYPNFTDVQLGEIKTRTLILCGDHDIIKYSHLKKLTKLLPNACFQVIPGTTHNYRTEKPDVVNQIILNFFKS